MCVFLGTISFYLPKPLRIRRLLLAFTYSTCVSHTVFLISSYGAPLSQRASCLALYSSLFGPHGAVNYKYMYMYDYIVTNSINSLLIVSRCIPNGTHYWANLAHTSKLIKNSGHTSVFLCREDNLGFPIVCSIIIYSKFFSQNLGLSSKLILNYTM